MNSLPKAVLAQTNSSQNPYRTLKVVSGQLKDGNITIPSGSTVKVNGTNPVNGDTVASLYVDGIYVLLGIISSTAAKQGVDTANIANGQSTGTGSVAYGASMPGFQPSLTVYDTLNYGCRITSFDDSGFTYAVFRSDGSTSAGGETVGVLWK